MALETWEEPTTPVFVYGSEYEPRPSIGEAGTLYANADTASEDDLSDADMEKYDVDEYVAFTGTRPHRPH